MVEAKDVVDLVQLFKHEGIDVWLVGGWGVDALLGEQTRPHEDVDIVIEEKNVPKSRKLLKEKGFKDVERDDTSAWNFVLGDSKSHKIDVHAIVFDEIGNGTYGPAGKGIMFPVASLTGNGTINGHPVKCISAEYMVKFIAPWLYKRRDKDFKDVSALCKKFEIDYPIVVKLYIMCGLAFSGKSTLAKRIAEHTGREIIAFDKLWVEEDKVKPVPKNVDGWRQIRKLAQGKILKALKDGKSVIYDDTNARREHREELRNLAKQAGAESIVVYLDTPLEIIRAREEANKDSQNRHEVEPHNFQKVLEDLEVPSGDEEVLIFTPKTDINDFLKKLD